MIRGHCAKARHCHSPEERDQVVDQQVTDDDLWDHIALVLGHHSGPPDPAAFAAFMEDHPALTRGTKAAPSNGKEPPGGQ